MYLVYGKPMNTFMMKRAASMFSPITEQAAVKILREEGIECQKLDNDTWILVNGEPRQVKDAIAIATLESEENDSIPMKFFTQLGALQYLYKRGYRLEVE